MITSSVKITSIFGKYPCGIKEWCSHFCGHKACEKCAFRLRPFACKDEVIDMENKSRSELSKISTMGIACRICD